MGIPTNITSGQGCVPTSSNCVIWQGPDIPCIDLCHGDSVTDVVFKLATELCDILDQLDIKTFDLTCFNPVCPDPKNFHDLIQFLIGRICKLQECVLEPGCEDKCKEPVVTSDCPDKCIVTVAPCFQFVNQIGDTVTTMTLTDYVVAIGNKLCQRVGQIAVNAARINAIEPQVDTIALRVTTLEDEVNAIIVTLPASCLYPADTSVATGVGAIATELCNLEQATGTPIELLQAIQKQCINLANSKQLTNQNSNMGSISGWVVEYQTVADSLNNMWLTICDMRSAIQNILATCCCTDCDDVDITMTASLSGSTLSLFFTGSIPAGLTDCYPNGNFVTITDANGGSYTTYVQVVNNLNSSVNINLDATPLNTDTNLSIVIQGCWNRPAPGSDCGGLRCERILTYNIINTAPCPEPVTITPAITTIDYSFSNNVSGPVTYTVELYTSPGGGFVTSFTHANPAQFAVLSGQFTGLTGDTNYFIQIKVTILGACDPNPCNTKICPQAFVSTLPYPCAAPEDVSATGIS